MDLDNLLFSEDLCLSRHRRTDILQLVKNLNNPSISKNLKRPPFPYTEADAIKWYDFLDLEKEIGPQSAQLRWVIRQRSSSLLLGDLSFTELDEPGVYRLGYWLAEDYWGKGVMTNAVATAIGIAREKEVSKIVAEVKDGNFGSRRVLEKNNFVFKGCADDEWSGLKFKVWKFELQLIAATC
jgi:[ribosomal protein S5]-alanine N-acetyltransferase